MADPLEDVGREHLRFLSAVVAALGKDFLNDHQRQVAADHHFHLAELELHLERVVENSLPARHDRAPSGKFAPSGMDTNDPRIAQPDGFHFLGVEAFEGVIEGAVGGEYCFAIGHDVVP